MMGGQLTRIASHPRSPKVDQDHRSMVQAAQCQDRPSDSGTLVLFVSYQHRPDLRCGIQRVWASREREDW
jgi:hypothetical protein